MTHKHEINPKKGDKEKDTGDSTPVEVKFHKINREIKSPVSAKDFIDMKVQAPKELVEELIQVGLTMLVAASKRFRTALALYIAACVSGGESVFGAFKTKQTRVLYICLSEDTIRFNDRVRQLVDYVGVLHFELTTDEEYRDAQFLKRLRAYIIKRKFNFIVIDTLDDVLELRTRNSRSRKTEFIRELRKLANDTQTAIVVIHHSDSKDLSENLFQAKTLEAGSDNVILVSNSFFENERDILTLRHYGRLYPKRDIYLERKHGDQAFTKLDEMPVLQSEVDLLEKVSLLANAGLSQKDMAKVLEISQGYVSKTLKKVDLSTDDFDVVYDDDIEEFLVPENSDEFEDEEDSQAETGNTNSSKEEEQSEPEK